MADVDPPVNTNILCSEGMFELRMRWSNLIDFSQQNDWNLNILIKQPQVSLKWAIKYQQPGSEVFWGGLAH